MPTPPIAGEARVAGSEIRLFGHQQPLCWKFAEKRSQGKRSIKGVEKIHKSRLFLMKVIVKNGIKRRAR